MLQVDLLALFPSEERVCSAGGRPCPRSALWIVENLGIVNRRLLLRLHTDSAGSVRSMDKIIVPRKRSSGLPGLDGHRCEWQIALAWNRLLLRHYFCSEPVGTCDFRLLNLFLGCGWRRGLDGSGRVGLKALRDYLAEVSVWNLKWVSQVCLLTLGLNVGGSALPILHSSELCASRNA